MKNVLCVLLFTFLLSCEESPTAVNSKGIAIEFDITKCQIEGNHAFIPAPRTSIEDVVSIINKFEKANGVKVTSFCPQFDYDSDHGIESIYLTFEEFEENEQ